MVKMPTGWTSCSPVCITNVREDTFYTGNVSCAEVAVSASICCSTRIQFSFDDAVVVGMLLIAAAAAACVPIVRWWSDRRLSMRELPPLFIVQSAQRWSE